MSAELNNPLKIVTRIHRELIVHFQGECEGLDVQREARLVRRALRADFIATYQRAASRNEPFEYKGALSFHQIVALSLLLPTFGGEKLALTIAVPLERSLIAGIARATAIMLESLVHNPCIRELKLVLPLGVNTFVGAPPYDTGWRAWTCFIVALKALVRRNMGLRKVWIHSPPWFYSPTTQEELTAIATSTLDELRMAILMGTHDRVGARCMFHTMPQPLLEIIFDKAGLDAPCDVVIEELKGREAQRNVSQDLLYIAEWVG